MLHVTPDSKIMSNEKSIGPDFSLRSGVEEVHIDEISKPRPVRSNVHPNVAELRSGNGAEALYL